MKIEYPMLLIAAPLLTIGIFALAWAARRRRRAAAASWSAALGAQAMRIGRRSPWLLALVALLTAIGMAGPRWGSLSQTTESRAINVMVVMDVSRSMTATDVTPDRLTRASGLARRLVQDLSGDRIGLIAFSGRGYLLSPLTLDQSAIALQLDALDAEMASEGGSALASALNQARIVLNASSQGGDRAVVVFTDGESFDDASQLTAAGSALHDAKITLVAVPVGETSGARIPEAAGGFRKDSSGREIITYRRDDLLRIAVEAAEGVMVPANAADPSGEARRVLSRLARAPARDRATADLVPRAWICALIAALLLLAQTVTRRSAALVGLFLLAGVGAAQAQRPSPGSRYLAQGDSARARVALMREATRLNSDTAWFNAGTAALLAGDMPTATLALQRATTSLDPELRRRALYNLGTAYLQQARRDTTRRDSLLTAAASQLQSALLLGPTDRDAKFNYELARKLKPPTPPNPSGGGGKGKGQPPPSPPKNDKGAMSKAEAEQVLSAMERAERETRQSQYQKQRRGQPPTGPDW
ncbi:MAG: VWA domain-containing protein [Gemmatimonadales bacterium]